MTLAPLTQVLIAVAVALALLGVIIPTALTLLLWAQVAVRLLRLRITTIFFKAQAKAYSAQARAYAALARRIEAVNDYAAALDAQLSAMQDDLSRQPLSQRTREEQIEHVDRHFAVYTASIVAKGVVLLMIALAVALGIAIARIYDKATP